MDAVSPLPPIQFPFASYLGAMDSHQFLAVILAIVFIFWAVYTAIAAYHLIRYGHRSLVVLPLLAIHVFVSGWFGLIAVSGFY